MTRRIVITRLLNSIEGKPPTNMIHRHTFCTCDLDLDQKTLIHKDHLKIPKILLYLHTKINFLDQGCQKLEQYRQREKCD